MSRSFSIKTLGCKLNQYESSIIYSQFINNGWIVKPFGAESVDIVIINTCTVTNRSDKKCRNYIRQGARFSKTGKVIVTGCMVDNNSNNIMEMTEVIGVYKNSEKDLILREVDKYLRYSGYSEESYLKTDNKTVEDESNVISNTIKLDRTRGFIKIQDGCDGECSYCIVPSVRGRPASRDYNSILEHANQLVSNGCPELVFTGITIGKYLSKGRDLADLAHDITRHSGRFRIRFSSIEPVHVTDKIIDLLKSEKVCSHLHIPLQSGSEKVLSLMKRPYTAGQYMKSIDRIKSKYPDIAIGTDIIIGFPGEDEKDFKDTLRIIESAGFFYVHQFTYSSRSGTAAAELKSSCSSGEIKERSKRIKELSRRYGDEYRGKFIDRILPCVIEKNRNRDGFSGVSDNYIKIVLDDSHLNSEKAGKIAEVKLTNYDGNVCRGVII